MELPLAYSWPWPAAGKTRAASAEYPQFSNGLRMTSPSARKMRSVGVAARLPHTRVRTSLNGSRRTTSRGTIPQNVHRCMGSLIDLETRLSASAGGRKSGLFIPGHHSIPYRLQATATGTEQACAQTPRWHDGRSALQEMGVHGTLCPSEGSMIRGMAHVCIGKGPCGTERFYRSGLGLEKAFDFIRAGQTIGFYLRASAETYIEVFCMNEVRADGRARSNTCALRSTTSGQRSGSSARDTTRRRESLARTELAGVDD